MVVSSSEFGRTIIPDREVVRITVGYMHLHVFASSLLFMCFYVHVHFAGRSNCSHLSHRFNFSNACDAALKDGVG